MSMTVLVAPSCDASLDNTVSEKSLRCPFFLERWRGGWREEEWYCRNIMLVAPTRLRWEINAETTVLVFVDYMWQFVSFTASRYQRYRARLVCVAGVPYKLRYVNWRAKAFRWFSSGAYCRLANCRIVNWDVAHFVCARWRLFLSFFLTLPANRYIFHLTFFFSSSFPLEIDRWPWINRHLRS